MKRKIAVWILVGIILSTMRVVYSNNHQMIYLDPNYAIDERVDDLMNRMTLREKIAQLNQLNASKFMVSDEDLYENMSQDSFRLFIQAGYAGSIKNAYQIHVANEIQRLAEFSRLKIPILINANSVHGHALCWGGTVFPTSIGMTSSWHPNLVKKCAGITARELRATGNHWNNSPTVDICRDPRWGRVGESVGEDPFLASQMGRAIVQGYQGEDGLSEHSVLSCLKHFAAGGTPVNGINFAPMEISERTLREVYLPPFKAGIEAGVATIMAAHQDIGGIPCHASEFLLQDVLREEWGFEGLVLTDWMDIERLVYVHHIAENNKDAVHIGVNAGLDVHMHGPEFMFHVEDLVNEGVIPAFRIDKATRKMLEYKFKLGLFENRYVDEETANTILFSKDHQKIALQMARESIVLLKNENNLLPLSNPKAKIFLTGPNANNLAQMGDWAGPQPDDQVVTVLEGMKSIFTHGQINYFPCGKIGAITQKEIKQAAKNAKKADIAILVVGGNHYRFNDKGVLNKARPERTGGENVDLTSLELQGKQLELVKSVHKTGTPVVVVLIGGRPLAIDWLSKNIDGIVQAWEPGSMGGQAVAEVLRGDYNPGGKLPISMLRSTGHIGNTYDHKPSQFFMNYKFSDSTAFVYEFGYGLSYTQFVYTNLIFPEVSAVEDNLPVQITVQNTGDREGDEVVQVYINDLVSSVTTPVKKLIEFRRIHLAPGQMKNVSFTIPADRLSLLDQKMKRVVEPGEFKLQVGNLTRKIVIQ